MKRANQGVVNHFVLFVDLCCLTDNARQCLGCIQRTDLAQTKVNNKQRSSNECGSIGM